MSQEKAPKPASYSPTDTAETESVDIFRKLVDHSRVKLDLKERDKLPNIDGYMELIDDTGSPFGKLEVQIKKLPNDATKIQTPISLFAYSDQSTCNPVILVGVDTKNEKAYWFHINSKLLESSIDRTSQKSITINFAPEKVVDGASTTYLTEWKIVADSYLHLKEIDEEYEKLKASSNALIGLGDRETLTDDERKELIKTLAKKRRQEEERKEAEIRYEERKKKMNMILESIHISGTDFIDFLLGEEVLAQLIANYDSIFYEHKMEPFVSEIESSLIASIRSRLTEIQNRERDRGQFEILITPPIHLDNDCGYNNILDCCFPFYCNLEGLSTFVAFLMDNKEKIKSRAMYILPKTIETSRDSFPDGFWSDSIDVVGYLKDHRVDFKIADAESGNCKKNAASR